MLFQEPFNLTLNKHTYKVEPPEISELLDGHYSLLVRCLRPSARGAYRVCRRGTRAIGAAT